MTTSTSFNSRFTLLGVTTLTLSWLAYNHYRPWINFHSEFLAFIGLAGLWIGLLRHVIIFPSASLWIAGIALLPWLQYGVGIMVFGGDAGVVSGYLLGLAFAIGVGYAGSRIWLHSLWIAALVSAAIGVAQWFHLEGDIFGVFAVAVEQGDRAMGNVGQANQLATLLLMGMMALVYALERGVMQRGVMGIAVAFLTLGLILSQSRSGMVGAVVAAVWLMVRLPYRKNMVLIGGWLVIFVMGTLALPHVSDMLRGASVRGLQTTAPITQRLDLWQQIAHAILQSPWWGYGWNQTPAAQAAGALAHPDAILGGYAHNGVMDVVAWNGIPLGLLLCGMVAYWFISRLRRARTPPAVCAMASLLVILIHSLLEYPFAYAYFVVAIGLLVGVVEAETAAKTFTLPRRAGAAMLAVLLPIGLWTGYEYTRIEEDFRVVRYRAMGITDYAPADYQLSRPVLLTQLDALLQSHSMVIRATLPDSDVQLLGATARRFADDTVWCRYTQALALKGRELEVRRELDTMQALFGENSYRICSSQLRRLSP
jgi:O-antigen ligase